MQTPSPEIVKSWEMIAGELTLAGWSWRYTTHLNRLGETFFCVDAHRDGGKHYIVQADELLTAFLELEQQAPTIFTIRPHLGGWQCVEGGGIAPYYLGRGASPGY